MGYKSGDIWCEARTCLLHKHGPVTWYGKASCPLCRLNRLQDEQAQASIARELYGVKINQVIITGKLDRKPEVQGKDRRKKSDISRVLFRIENTRNDNGTERKTWINVLWQGKIYHDAMISMDPGTRVAVKGCLANIKIGGSFTLGIKATEVELI